MIATGCRIANYEILAPVGGGAMGEVYKAKDLRLGRVVALKFLPADLARDPNARRRFLREAQSVALLDHPNVATIYEAGETEGGRAFIALAFYEGETLQQKLENGPLPLAEAVGIARQIARGLAAAHRQQIVHRDVKPSNVVVLPDGTVKLLDFGLAKMAGATTLTRLGSFPGTPAYKSPEQTRGEKVDPRSDLWALGVVLYEMVTGRAPFGGEYEQAVIYAILNEPPRPLDSPRAFPSELAEAVERALAKDPTVRYATAEELEGDLVRIPLEPGGKATRRPAAQSRRPRLRHPKGAALALAVLVTLGCAAGFWWRWEHRWDFTPEVGRLVEQGNRLEWQDESERTLTHAASIYERALVLDPNNPLIQAQLAALLARIETQSLESSRREKIQRLTAAALEKAPDDPMPWVAQSKLLLLEQTPLAAEQAARKAIEQDSGLDRGFTLLGEALFAQGRTDASFEAFRRSTEVEGGYVRAELVYAAKLVQAGRYDEAAAEFRKVLMYIPFQTTAQKSLGEIYLIQGRYYDAIPLLKEVFEATQDARAADSLGNAYFGLNHLDEAIKAFTDAYRLNPQPLTALNLAETYEKKGQTREAQAWYERALRSFDGALAKDGPRANLLNQRAYCAAKLGRFGEAINNVEEALLFSPDSNAFFFGAAQIFAMAGLREELFPWVRKAIQAGYSREEFRNGLVFRDYQEDPRFQEILESAAR